MANSLGTTEEQRGGRVVHKPSGASVAIRLEHGAMVQEIEEEGLRADNKVAYYIGAGMVGPQLFRARGIICCNRPFRSIPRRTSGI